MKIFVTGSNGLLGQKLTTLLDRDADVQLIATGRRASVLPLQRGEYRTLDITLEREVEQTIASVKPEVLIHTAAMTNVDQCENDHEGCWNSNVEAVKHIIHACEKHNVHLVYLSTDFVFDGSHGPLGETEPVKPVNFYGQSKAAAEDLVMKSSTTWSIIRTVLVYGITRDMSRSNIVLWVKENLEKGKPIRVVNDQWRTPTLAEDLAAGTVLAAKKMARGIYHISGKDMLTPFDIAIRTADYFSLDKTLITPVDASVFQQPARRPSKTGFVIEKARKELGYEPHSFEEGLGILARQIRYPDTI